MISVKKEFYIIILVALLNKCDYFIFKEVKIKKICKIIDFLQGNTIKKITGKKESGNNKDFCFRKWQIDGIFA